MGRPGPELGRRAGEEQVLVCPLVPCRAGQLSECPGRLRDWSGFSVQDSLACGVTCASANMGPGAQNRCPASAQTELFGSLWSVSGRIKWFNRIHFAWWHFKYRNSAPFSGDKKPFSYGCERPVISRPPWLQGPAGPWPALSPCAVPVAVKVKPGASGVP